MAHECEICYEICYCDCDDLDGLYQPFDCPHFDRHAEEAKEDPEDWDLEDI